MTQKDLPRSILEILRRDSANAFRVSLEEKRLSSTLHAHHGEHFADLSQILWSIEVLHDLSVLNFSGGRTVL